MDNFERSLNLLDLVKAEQRAADTTVQADDSLIDYSGQRQPIEQVVDFVEDGVDIGRFLSQSATAFFSESERIVDPFVFVVASEHVNLVGEFDLECH